MRKLALLPFLAFVLSCTDSTLLRLEDDLTVAGANGEPHLMATAAPGLFQMVPFKGKNGSWWTGDVGAGCEGSDDNLWAIGPGEINATHLGRSDYGVTNCWALDESQPAGLRFIAQDGWVEAANGDRLYWHGSAEMGTVAILDMDELTYWMGPFWFDGGTGRFEGATGWFTQSGTFAEDLATGTDNWDGMIAY